MLFFFRISKQVIFFLFFFWEIFYKTSNKPVFSLVHHQSNLVFSSNKSPWNSHNSRFAWWKNNFSTDFHQPVSETSWNIQKIHNFFLLKKLVSAALLATKNLSIKWLFFFVPNINNRPKKLFFLQLNINNSVFFSTNYLWLIQHLNKFHGSSSIFVIATCNQCRN